MTVTGRAGHTRRRSVPAGPAGETERAGRVGRETARGQANLVALVAALFAVTTATVVGIAVADSALAGAARDADERHAAAAVAAGLVGADSPLTNRTNVLDRGAVAGLDGGWLRSRYPALDGRSFRVTLGEEVVAGDRTVTGGTTVQRVVLVERTRELSFVPAFSGGNAATLPQRARRVDVDIDAPKNRSVGTVRADRRTVLHDPSGRLTGSYTVSLSLRETVRLTFVANGSLERGDVTLTLYPRDTNKAVLAVTVDG